MEEPGSADQGEGWRSVSESLVEEELLVEDPQVEEADEPRPPAGDDTAERSEQSQGGDGHAAAELPSVPPTCGTEGREATAQVAPPPGENDRGEEASAPVPAPAPACTVGAHHSGDGRKQTLREAFNAEPSSVKGAGAPSPSPPDTAPVAAVGVEGDSDGDAKPFQAPGQSAPARSACYNRRGSKKLGSNSSLLELAVDLDTESSEGEDDAAAPWCNGEPVDTSPSASPQRLHRLSKSSSNKGEAEFEEKRRSSPLNLKDSLLKQDSTSRLVSAPGGPASAQAQQQELQRSASSSSITVHHGLRRLQRESTHLHNSSRFGSLSGSVVSSNNMFHKSESKMGATTAGIEAQILSSYIPRMAVQRMEQMARYSLSTMETSKLPNFLQERPPTEFFPAAVLFADISGFSKLTSKINAKLALKANTKLKTVSHHASTNSGSDGRSSETLLRLLNEYFTPLIEVICAHGGDVIKFAGDALLVIWPVQDDETLSSQVMECAMCALSIQASMRDVTTSEGIVLQTKLTVAAGENMRGVYVGGERSQGGTAQWEFFTAGDAMPQVEYAEKVKAVQPGEVVLTPQAWELVKHLECTATEGRDGHMVLNGMGKNQPKLYEPVMLVESWGAANPDLETQMVKYLSSFVPEGVRSRVVGRNMDLSRLLRSMEDSAEIRTLSVLFMSIDGMDFDQETTLDQVQEVVSRIQRCLYEYGGTMRQFLVEDKGATFIGAFGVPPFSHTDDPERAVRCAMDIKASLAAVPGVSVAIGVATGRALCGAVGSLHRCEYTLAGDVVVLSARLMKGSKADILVDVKTYEKCDKVAFVEVEGIFIKGKDTYITAYKPVGKKTILRDSSIDVNANDDQRDLLSPMVGRMTEMSLLHRATAALSPARRARALLFMGNTGLGKTRLLQEAVQEARRNSHLSVFTLNTSSLDSKMPFRAFRPVLLQLLNLTKSPNPNTWSLVQHKIIQRSLQQLDDKFRKLESTNKGQILRWATSLRRATNATRHRILTGKTMERTRFRQADDHQTAEGLMPCDWFAVDDMDASRSSRSRRTTMESHQESFQESAQESRRTTLESFEGSRRTTLESPACTNHGSSTMDTLQPTTSKRAVSRVMSSMTSLTEESPLVALAPLLGVVFGYAWEDNNTTTQIADSDRMQQVVIFVLRLLQIALHDRPSMFFADDAHLMDPFSFKVLIGMLSMDGLLAVAAVSSEAVENLQFEQHGWMARLKGHPSTMLLELKPLSTTSVMKLMCKLLQVKETQLPPELKTMIVTKVEGNAMVALEFARSLREQILKSCGVQPAATDQMGSLLASIRPAELTKLMGCIPDSMQAMIQMRIDSIAPEAQMLLKVASVIGPVFHMRMVSRIFPLDMDLAFIDLAVLESKMLIRPRQEADIDDEKALLNRTYEFCSSHIMDVVYSLMTYDLKRKLHVVHAAMLELHQGATNTVESLSQVSHHWVGGGEYLKAVAYLEQAGQLAQTYRAYQQSLEIFNRIIDISITQGLEVSDHQEAGWMVALCLAYKGMGRHQEAITMLSRALNVNEPGIQKKLRSTRYYYKHMLALHLRGDTFMGQLLCGLKLHSFGNFQQIVRSSTFNQEGLTTVQLTEKHQSIATIHVLVQLFELHYSENHMRKAMCMALMLLKITTKVADPVKFTLAASALSLMLMHIGPNHFNPCKISKMFRDEALAVFANTPRVSLPVEVMRVRVWIALRDLVEGDISGALEGMLDVVRIGEMQRKTGDLDQARLLYAMVLYMRGDYRAAVISNDTAIASGEHVGDIKTVGQGMLSMVRVFLKLGQVDKAMLWLKSHQIMVESLEWSDSANDISFLCILGHAWFRKGKLERAFTILSAIIEELVPREDGPFSPMNLQAFLVPDLLLMLETLILVHFDVETTIREREREREREEKIVDFTIERSDSSRLKRLATAMRHLQGERSMLAASNTVVPDKGPSQGRREERLSEGNYSFDASRIPSVSDDGKAPSFTDHPLRAARTPKRPKKSKRKSVMQWAGIYDEARIQTVDGLELQEVQDASQKVIGVVKMCSKVFPVLKPKLLYCKGVHSLARNKPEKAHRQFEAAMEAAVSLNCPFMAGQIALDAADLLPSNVPQRPLYLKKAVAWLTGDEVDQHFKEMAGLLLNGQPRMNSGTVKLVTQISDRFETEVINDMARGEGQMEHRMSNTTTHESVSDGEDYEQPTGRSESEKNLLPDAALERMSRYSMRRSSNANVSHFSSASTSTPATSRLSIFNTWW